MAIHFTSLFYLFIFCLSICILVLSASPSLVLNLIHPRKIYSLGLVNVSDIEKASVARLQYLQSKASGDIIAHLSPSIPSAFLVNISIGNPPIIQFLDMDMASDLTWLQCRPCTNCYRQSIQLYNPSRSTTYRNEFDSCITYEHSGISLHFNAKTRYCEYYMEYIDGSGSRGTLVKETLTFNTIYGESSSASLPNVAFGCGHDNFGEIQTGTGTLGQGYGRFSLVHRFGSKFSYCFGSLDDIWNPHNVLVIGDDGNVMGDTTPLEIENGLYYVTMEGISVDGTLLPINPRVFQRDYQTGFHGTIIDTGTSYIFLVKEAYDPLKSKIEEVFGGRFKTAYVSGFMMECYFGDIERDLVESGFPVITFHFSDGAELSLDVKSIFLKEKPGVFCLAVVPSSTGDNMNIIGATAQQNYNIGYDLKDKKVSFERIDCSVLFDY